MKKSIERIVLALLMISLGMCRVSALAQQDQSPTLDETQHWLNVKPDAVAAVWARVQVTHGLEIAYQLDANKMKSWEGVQTYTTTSGENITSVKADPCQFANHDTTCIDIPGKHSYYRNQPAASYASDPASVRIYLIPGVSDAEVNSIVKALKHWAVLRGTHLVNDDLFKP
jgi:hypothetical protein